MNKKIVIAKNAGFCMGVKRAFDNSIELAKNHKNICIYGDIVHNKFALEKIKKNSIPVINKIEDIINNKEIKNVIIRAHGISPNLENRLLQAGKKIFDLTCPIVKQVQLLAQKLSNENKTIIIYGKNNHPEVLGIIGYIKNDFHLVNNIDQIKALPLQELKNPVLLSQTTMNSEIFNDISNYLTNNLPAIEIHNTLCNYPLNMQKEALKLVNRVDLILVIGDKTSSNTRTLYEKVKKHCQALFIENIEDLENENVLSDQNISSIALTGGASTPDFQIKKIYDYLLG